jgi:hypothetical protein
LKLKKLLLLFLILTTFNACHHKPEIAGVILSQYYNSCPEKEYDFGEMITIGDPSDKFMITLPYEWDIQETYNDTLYGMIATNAPLSEDNPDAFLLLSVTGYKTSDSLLGYFTKEVTSLHKDKTMKVLEAGKMNYNDRDSFWLKFETIENGHTILNIVRYIKSEMTNEVYLIQSSVNKTGNYDEKICILKQLADSFELVE